MKQFDFNKARDYLINQLDGYYRTILDTEDRDTIQSSRLAFMTTVVIGQELGILKGEDLKEYSTDVLFKLGKEYNYDK